ncbi:hypothetical protein UCREL1_4382 [Eutypa lata UCREL1]|uniref:Protein HRI1 n=1 Tax=Eutypa lata (strain UCR-EL1) TaxID=1287681 RepID=M7SQ88_EUTLA|nr:hypothetical protein UCREL1_4382 [Eutypa lata UCREL1]
MGSISIREYIRWLPDPPSENTSTLVLTSPGRRFVDIRMLKTAKGGGGGGEKEETEIEWAFAGTSSSSEETRAETGALVKHSVWRHFVDSRTRDAESVVDEADMFPHSEGGGGGGGGGDGDGDDDGGSHALEKGRMVNPDTGRETDYEEMWRDVEPRAVPSLSNGSGDDDDGGKIRSLVLELRDDGAGRRGLVVCLGRYCQGVVRDGDAFALEQWEWKEWKEGGEGGNGGGGGGGWARRRRVGAPALYLPCRDAIEKVTGLEVGGRVERDGVGWTVVEVS